MTQVVTGKAGLYGREAFGVTLRRKHWQLEVSMFGGFIDLSRADEARAISHGKMERNLNRPVNVERKWRFELWSRVGTGCCDI